MVKDINTNGSSNWNWLRVMDGVLYFMAYTEDYGRELWRSDGTAEGTSMVKDINSGSNSSFYWPEGFFYRELFLEYDGLLYFTADDGGAYGVEVWRTDGTSNGTEMIVDATHGNESSWPTRYTIYGASYTSLLTVRTEAGICGSTGTIRGLLSPIQSLPESVRIVLSTPSLE